MTKKRKIEKPEREVTKRQLSRWQQQQKRQHIILGIGIFIIVAVFGIVGVGWYIGQYQPLHQTAIRVNDTEFDMDYYIEVLKLAGRGQPPEYMQYLAGSVVNEIAQIEFIRQGALKIGISVSNNEVQEALEGSDLPVNDVTRDLVRRAILLNKLRDEYFEHQVPVSADQRHILATLLESESQATEVRARIESGEDFGELAGELSLEALFKAENGDLGWHPKDVLARLLATSVPGEYAFGSEVGVLSPPIYDEEVARGVGYWLIKVSERAGGSEEAHVHAMLLGSEAEAREVSARLEAGENFTALAEELSQHGVSSGRGGDLDWLTPGTMSPAFDEFVFNLDIELGTLSAPVRDETIATKGGYWLLKVLDKDDNREISDDDRDRLKGVALNEWLSALWDDPENEIDDSYLDEEKKAWAIVKAITELEREQGG